MCLPHIYRARIQAVGQERQTIYHVLPTIIMAIVLNIPRYKREDLITSNIRLFFRFISVSSLGLVLQKKENYLR